MSPRLLLLCTPVILLQLFFIFTTNSSRLAYNCPSICVCRANNDKSLDVDCSGIGLKDIPIADIPGNVIRLLLNGNKIENIETIRNANLEQLRTLDLRGNPIKTIPNQVFKAMRSLTELYLNTNTIEPLGFDGLDLKLLSISGYGGNSVPRNIFYPNAKTLKELRITDTRIERLPDGFFAPFTLLEVLDLTGNHLNDMSSLFSSGHSTIRNLILKDNKMEVLSGYCKSFANLTSLDVSCNNLLTLPSNVSDCFPYLEMLNASSNRLSHLPRRLGSYVAFLDVHRNALHTLANGFLSSMGDSLVQLDLGHNPWHEINTNELGLAQSLTELRLQNMSSIDLDLTPIESWQSEKRLRGFRVLDLSHNLHLKSYKIPEKTAILNLLFTHSALTEFPIVHKRHGKIFHCDISWNALRTLHVTRSLSRLNASHNRIENMIISDVWIEIDVLDVSYNDISRTEDIFIDETSFLRNLNFTFNRIENITSFYRVPPEISGRFGYRLHPIRMDFSYNQIHSINESAFADVPPLVNLKLNNNRLKSIPANVFERQSRLSKLDLNDNRISADLFSSNKFAHSIRFMIYLHLESNNITNVSLLNLEKFKYLQSLYLSNNRFDSLPDRFLTRNRRLKRVVIYNTSLECTCNVTMVIANALATSPRNLQVEGNCFDSSESEQKSLGDMLRVLKSNKWLCDGSELCQTMKCVLTDKCQHSKVDFNCSCIPLSSANYTRFFTFPLYQNPAGTPSWDSEQNRQLMFCKEPSCHDDTMITRKPQLYYNESIALQDRGQCKWIFDRNNQNNSTMWYGNMVQCARVPTLIDMFCKVDTKVEMKRNIHSVLVVALIAGAIFVVAIVLIVMKKLKSHNALPLEDFSDLHALEDFDFLNANSAKEQF